jgi:uncharacterized protein (UPF0297 family)
MLRASREGNFAMTEGTSRFDGLFSAANQTRETLMNLDAQTSKRTDVQMSKSKDPNFQRTTIYIPRELHRKFKAAAVVRGIDMSDIVSDLLKEWLQKELDI